VGLQLVAEDLPAVRAVSRIDLYVLEGGLSVSVVNLLADSLSDRIYLLGREGWPTTILAPFQRDHVLNLN
jgi:hypothetical protein